MVDIEKLYNELNDKYSAVVTELEKYKDSFTPKFACGQKLFIIDIAKKEISTLTVDEITITMFGVSYREFISETEFKQYPEQYCFESEKDAEIVLNTLK